MKRFLLLSAVALVTACSGPTRLPVATQADADRSGVELARLESGRMLYLNRCTACHRAVQPAKFAPDAWVGHVMEMREKAHLDERELRDVLAYLQTMSEAPPVAN